MSSKPETRYRLRVEKHIDPAIYGLKLNLPYAAGVADSWYSGMQGSLWVEYKWMDKLPVRVPLDLIHGNDPWITQLQQDWLVGRHNEGRAVAVILGTRAGGIALPRLSWQNIWPPGVLSLWDPKQVADWIMTEMRKC